MTDSTITVLLTWLAWSRGWTTKLGFEQTTKSYHLRRRLQAASHAIDGGFPQANLVRLHYRSCFAGTMSSVRG